MAQKKSSNPLSLMIWLGLLGAFLASWIAPKVISWYFEPPVNIGVNCRAATEWSMHKLQLTQLVGLGLGAVAGLVIGLTRLRNRDDVNDPL